MRHRRRFQAAILLGQLDNGLWLGAFFRPGRVGRLNSRMYRMLAKLPGAGIDFAHLSYRIPRMANSEVKRFTEASKADSDLLDAVKTSSGSLDAVAAFAAARG